MQSDARPTIESTEGRYRVIWLIDGILLMLLAGFMSLPAIADLVVGSPDWHSFLYAAAVTFFAGGILVLANRTHSVNLRHRDAFLVTTSGWVLVSAFGALPFLFADLPVDYTDAFFESISGVTTTGSTVLVGLDDMAPGILLWRSLLQWIGGIGIVATAVAILPFLRIGGMQLFRTESSDKSEKLFPRPGQVALAIGSVYLGLTFMCVAAYAIGGMTLFDALNHAMTTISTGGYSTHDASMGHFDSTYIRLVSSVFMIAGSLPLVLYVHSLQRGRQVFWEDSQVRAFLGMLAVFTLLIAFWVWISGRFGFGDALSHAAFNVISIATTTGYASSDYSLWGSLPVALFFALTFLGGCTGSTAGGIKTFRLQILFALLRQQVHQMLYRHAVATIRYEGKAVDSDIAQSVLLFVCLVFASVAVLTAALAATGLDLVTSITAAATAIANVGPGLGEIIGPAGNFAGVPDSAKWLLSAGMLLGRLEIMTVLVVLSPQFWRH